MKTDAEIYALMDAAEIEIKAVLKKYNLDLGVILDDTITLHHEQNHPSGDISIRAREAFKS